MITILFGMMWYFIIGFFFKGYSRISSFCLGREVLRVADATLSIVEEGSIIVVFNFPND